MIFFLYLFGLAFWVGLALLTPWGWLPYVLGVGYSVAFVFAMALCRVAGRNE